MFFDIELVDVNENIENFKFHKIPKEALDRTISVFRGALGSTTIEFSCLEGNVILHSKFFRGLMYSNHIEIVKTIKQENVEDSIEVSKINIKKPIKDKGVKE